MNFFRKYFFILVIIFFAFILRIWGVNFGLPHQLHQDEPIVINHALAYGAGDLNPHFFIVPPFSSYLLFIIYALYFVIGGITGFFSGTEDFALAFFKNPSSFYIIARMILGILPGTLYVWLSYILYKKIFSEKGGIYAASIVAFSFLCVVNSHYAYVDSIMLVFVLLTYIFLCDLMRQPSLRNYIFSAIFLGLAISTKYNAVLLALSFYIAHITIVVNNRSSKKKIILDKSLWCAIGTSILTFTITNPFSILDWQFFLQSITGKIRSNYMGWTHHISYSLFEGMGLGLLIAAALGIMVILLSQKKSKMLFFISFPLLFYLHLVIKSQRFSRYVLPLIPFLAMTAAFFVFGFLLPKTKTKLQKIVIVLLSIVLLIPTTAKSVKANLLFSGDDTRITSAEWIEKNIPINTKIAVDHTSFRPTIFQSKEQLLDKYAIVDSQRGLKKTKAKKLDFLVKAVGNKKTYKVYFLTYKDEERGQFLSTVPAIAYNINALKAEGISYVVINYNTYNREKEDFLKNLHNSADIIIEFSPYYDKKIRPRYDRVDATYMAVGSKELFSRRIMGPCLVIYKIRSG